MTVEERLHLVSDGMLTVMEAAEFVGLGRTSLYALMERGELPYVKFGSARRIPRRALVALAARHLVGGDFRSEQQSA